jgi:hypothetical protein
MAIISYVLIHPTQICYANDRVSNTSKADFSHLPEVRVSLPLQFHALCHCGQPEGIGTPQGMQRRARRTGGFTEAGGADGGRTNAQALGES